MTASSGAVVAAAVTVGALVGGADVIVADPPVSSMAIVPVMFTWRAHEYAIGASATMTENRSSGPNEPESKLESDATIWWVAEPVFTNTTVSPATTESDAGVKSKSTTETSTSAALAGAPAIANPTATDMPTAIERPTNLRLRTDPSIRTPQPDRTRMGLLCSEPEERAMRVAIGSDHAGYQLKTHLVRALGERGHEVDDLGTDSEASVDYPPICAAVGRRVASGAADRGIVLGGSGQGEQIAANKVRGVRAALCNDLYTARMAREHNDANVLAIGGRIVATGLADEILDVFLTTRFEGGRHQRRIDQITAIDDEPRP